MSFKYAKHVAALAMAGGLIGCGEGATTKATDERLAGLLENGIDSDHKAKSDERLAKLLGKENATGALAGPYGSQVEVADRAQLPQLLASALERNTRIGAAAQSINKADALRLNAIFGYLPQVSFVYDQSEVDQAVISTDNEVFELGEAQYPVTTTTLMLQQPILDLGRIFGIQYAKNARSLAEVDYIGTVRDVSYEVFDAYVVAVQAKRQSASLRQRQNLIGRQINSRNALEEIGLGNVVEESSLRSERANLAAEEANESARYANAIGDLSFLTGAVVRDISDVQLPSSIFGAERRVSADDAVEAGLTNNPAVMASALRAVGAEINRKRALSEDFAPVLNAYATLEAETREASRFGGGSETEDTTVGLRLTIPIFNARGNGYARLPATVDARAEVLEYHASRRQLETEIRATHARMGQLSKAVSSARSAASQAGRALSSERQRVEAGESVDLAVAARQLRLNLARERVSYYQAEYLRAWARLQYLMGEDLAKAAF
ncbi:TolC family protein [Actibacterium pelagium]|uniref:Protein CyaE n=1 Tax=Actibacterium pelagium TaxID=2029103 RepID=A0A917EI71_9RHOB|nr:TolC family protein [Actibacterium pelagium]GGE38856.1 protein CyaE [Actibacterium pelagium]